MKTLTFVVLVASLAIGCGSNSNNSTTSTTGGTTGVMQNPDMSPTCFTGTPANNADFLNACTSAPSIDIEPFYPTNAPNGVLPPLQ